MTFFNEFISGAFAGVTQVLVGHPFDTLKVIIQNNSNIKQFSIKNLYRGVKYPLPQSIICNSIVFSINDNLKYKFSNRLYSGFISGLCVTPIIFYLDIGKTKEQLRLPYKSIDLFRTKGFLSTLGRETSAFSLYFYTYDYCRENDFSIIESGSLSGLASWSFTYPLDVIRNRQIAQNISIYEAYKQGYLWNGYSYCILRSIITNACIFYTYETTKKIFNLKYNNFDIKFSDIDIINGHL